MKKVVNGFSIIEREGKKNYINDKKEILSEVWFDRAEDFTAYGLAFVALDGKTNVINSEGKLLLEKDYRTIRLFGNVIVAREVIMQGSRAKEIIDIMDKDGKKIISRNILKCASFVKDGYILLTDKKLGQNVIDRNGKLLFENWYAKVQPIKFSKEAEEIYFYVVKYNSRNKIVYNILDKDGKTPFSRKWFSYIVFENEEPSMGEALVISTKTIVKYEGKRYTWDLTGKNKLEEMN